MTKQTDEHRHFKRFDTYVRVHFKQHDDHKGESIQEKTGLSGDLSRGGLKIYSDDKIQVGSLIDLTIEIPDDPLPVKVCGEVAWSQKIKNKTSKYSFGVHFVGLSPVDKFRVLDYAYNNWLDDKIEEFSAEDPELNLNT